MGKNDTCAAEPCERLVGPHGGKGFCPLHLQRLRLWGNLTTPPPRQPRRKQERTKVDFIRAALAVETDECQVWPYAADQNGYGRCWFDDRVMPTHHVSLLLVGRPLPVHPEQTRHTCNNPPCFNPRHLLLGSYSENQMDRVAAGTANRGERNGRSRLALADVQAIRARYVRGNRWAPGNGAELAAEFGVSLKHLRKIADRETWEWAD